MGSNGLPFWGTRSSWRVKGLAQGLRVAELNWQPIDYRLIFSNFCPPRLVCYSNFCVKMWHAAILSGINYKLDLHSFYFLQVSLKFIQWFARHFGNRQTRAKALVSSFTFLWWTIMSNRGWCGSIHQLVCVCVCVWWNVKRKLQTHLTVNSESHHGRRFFSPLSFFFFWCCCQHRGLWG